MTPLTEFLLARIAEDEAWAENETFPQPWRMDAARVLAECEAKRRIIGMLVIDSDQHDLVLRLLALPYADHPDHDARWAL